MSATASKSSNSNSGPATSMAELMARHGNEFAALKKGQEVTGEVTAVASSGIFLRINNKTDVLVLEKDKRLFKQLLSLLHVGDTVSATVLYPESEEGYPLVTLRAFTEKKLWEKLERLHKSGEKLLVTITDTARGGFLVTTDIGITGFLPNSHVTSAKPDMVGQKISVSIIELSKDNKKVVFSQKGALTEEDFQNLAKQYKAGTHVHGKISGITQFGLFVALPYTKSGEEITVDGLVHISEVAWEKTADLSQHFHTGEDVDAVVIGIDPKSKRIDLSMKRLTADPFQKVLDSFPVEKKVTGTVKEMTETGVVLDLGDIDGIAVEGLIKKDKIPAATTYTAGQSVTATVVSVDSRKRKVMLTPVLLEKPLMYR